MVHTRVVAHRGASATHRENTLAGFTAAAEQGADWVELDVRRTRDGALAVIHDAYLPGGRAVVECDAADLPTEVPLLTPALDACGDLGVNIEIKNQRGEVDFDADESVADAVVAELGERAATDPALLDRVLVSCFRYPTIQRVRAAHSRVATGWLVGDRSDALVRVAADGHPALHPHDAFVDLGLVDRARALAIDITVWTVDDPDRMAELVGYGVAGIVTNHPDRARAVVDDLSV